MSRSLPQVWRRAAFLGSIWASIEIIIGSFLHSVRFPVSGAVLASVGVCILVAGARLWTDRGLVWRAGVICALMKSISPGGVILGPMAGILAESAILEIAIRLFGRHSVGFIAGGALAGTVPLLQKIFSLLVIYGIDAARLYVALYEFAAQSLGITRVRAVDLVGFLLLLYVALGTSGALLGASVARRTLRFQPEVPEPGASPAGFDLGDHGPAPRYSIPLLVAHGVALPAGILALTLLALPLAAVLVIAYAAAAFLRYRPVARRFASPRLWIELTLVSALAGLMLGGVTGTEHEGVWGGLLVGLQMALRASLAIVAFSCLSIELRNPVILSWFLRRGLGNLPEALRVAFAALPLFARSLGKEQRFLRRPLDSIAHSLALATSMLAPHEASAPAQMPVILLTGEKGSGKTTFLSSLVALLREHGRQAGGILAPAVLAEERQTGYDLLDLSKGTLRPFCRAGIAPTGMSVGPYHVYPDAVQAGITVLERDARARVDLLCIDEVGPLELAGGGWAPVLERLLPHPPVPVLLTVRPSLRERIIERWGCSAAEVWDITALTPGAARDRLSAMADALLSRAASLS